MYNNRMNLHRHLINYLEHCEIEKNLSPNTIKMYNFYLTDFIEWCQSYLGKDEIDVEDASHELVRKYRLDLNRRISYKTNEEIKKSTQKTFLVALRAFLKYLVVEEGLNALSPDKILLGKPDPQIPKVLDAEQLERLFAVQDLNKRSGMRDRAILEVLFSTGLRVSELVALNIEDINLNTGEFAVVGKGRKIRTVYLGGSSKEWLRRYIGTRRDSFKPLFLRYSGKKMDTDDVDGDTLRLTVRSVQRLVKKYVLRAGISTDATPHTLRHTFATGLLREGADLRSVQELLGHSNVATTQIYTHVTNKQLKDVHKKFHKDVDLDELDAKDLAVADEVSSIF
jgi:site-specific recombinase XerD